MVNDRLYGATHALKQFEVQEARWDQDVEMMENSRENYGDIIRNFSGMQEINKVRIR